MSEPAGHWVRTAGLALLCAVSIKRPYLSHLDSNWDVQWRRQVGSADPTVDPENRRKMPSFSCRPHDVRASAPSPSTFTTDETLEEKRNGRESHDGSGRCRRRWLCFLFALGGTMLYIKIRKRSREEACPTRSYLILGNRSRI